MYNNKSDQDPTKYNGEKHGELYSPEYAIHVNTEEQKGKKEQKSEEHENIGQGKLYSPQSAIHTSTNTQQKNQDSHEHHQGKDAGADDKGEKGSDRKAEVKVEKQNPELFGSKL